jgi:tRNA(Ile)-lysidine synthase TilS/MesJ
MKAKLSPSIWKLVEEQISPQFEADEPLNVFDPWNGATLNLRAYNGSNGMRSYDKSKWLTPGPLFKDDDEKLDEVYAQVKGLDYEIDPTNPHYTKSYDELSAKLELVLGRPLYKNKDKQNAGSAIEDAFNDEDELSSSNSLGTSYSTNSQPENDVQNILNSSDDDDAELRALLED